LALTATLAMTAVAVAQYAVPVIQVTGKVSPSKGGSKKKPKNATVRMAFTLNKEAHKTASRMTFFVPRDVVLSGKGFRYCPASKINQQGEAKCPKGSKIGEGTATAVLGPEQTPLDFTINVYAGSKNEVAVSLKGIVNIAFRGLIYRSGAPLGPKVTVDIPPSVQSPAPGLYSYLTGVDFTMSAKTTKKVRVKRKGKRVTVKRNYYFASLRGCPKDRTHDFGVMLTYADNDGGPGGQSDPIRDPSDCRR
jgi:hypothetical protein